MSCLHVLDNAGSKTESTRDAATHCLAAPSAAIRAAVNPEAAPKRESSLTVGVHRAWHGSLAPSVTAACTTLRNKLGCWGPDASTCGLSVRSFLVGQQHMHASIGASPYTLCPSGFLLVGLCYARWSRRWATAQCRKPATCSGPGWPMVSACMSCPRTVTAGPCQYSGDAMHTQHLFFSCTCRIALKWELVDSAATSFPCRVWAAVACMGSGLAASAWARLRVCKRGVIEWTALL